MCLQIESAQPSGVNAIPALVLALPFLAVAMFSSACSSDLPTQNSFSNNDSNHASSINAIENGLRPTYGTADEPVPTWTLAERMKHYDVPAMSIAVAMDGKLAWAKAYGEMEKGGGVAVNTETLFQAASLSKPVAALAALRMVDQKRITLDSPVNEALSSWKIPVNQYTRMAEVTLRQLLSHRAGTTVHGFRGYEGGEEIPTLVQILDGVAPANTDPVIVDKMPGESYRYSGGGYEVVQLLVQDVAAMDYADFVNRELFRPSHLARSNFAYPQPDPNTATGHTGPSSEPIPQPGRHYPELAAAGLWTTPTDLVKLGMQVANARNEGGGFLSKALALQMIPASADGAGLGFGLNNAGDGVAFVHNGHNPGFSARWINYADGRASVAILANSDSGGDLIREVLSAVGYTYGWKQDGYVERATITLNDDWANAISGDYAFDSSATDPVATIAVESGKLWLIGDLAGRTRLYAESPTKLFIGKGMNLDIETDENDRPVALNVEGEIVLQRLNTATSAHP